MKATKGNKVYTIDDKQVKHYQDAGFDITDDDGNVLAYGRGKTVPYDQYMAVVNELNEMKAKAASLAESTGEDPVPDGVTDAATPEISEKTGRRTK